MNRIPSLFLILILALAGCEYLPPPGPFPPGPPNPVDPRPVDPVNPEDCGPPSARAPLLERLAYSAATKQNRLRAEYLRTSPPDDSPANYQAAHDKIAKEASVAYHEELFNRMNPDGKFDEKAAKAARLEAASGFERAGR